MRPLGPTALTSTEARSAGFDIIRLQIANIDGPAVRSLRVRELKTLHDVGEPPVTGRRIFVVLEAVSETIGNFI
jgi:hypothetical protein